MLTPEAKVDIRGADLHLGIGSDELVKSSTHLRVGIDLNSGELFNISYSSDWLEIMEWNAVHNSIKFTAAIQGSMFTGIPRIDKNLALLFSC
ncbi:hypothetical protein UA38_00885 [Photobacterium kishitanii]|uniref:Uncharacterized protein n=1 Tax=Photobacterium kishitanii TaxID=318456 RepID=A0AAX0YWV4_9GAMM|nr:hypothetical protein [Photobacterium kishitanii]KJG59754.1 hypothetical protein UA38_00885 [Photobacterium kishitanii]KJG63043.1 hypothetical protein UA42_01255 [Photobacterium kishitanii]KJG67945.1 hypothetical protein UA40_01585 [Photobacterium kishitanii]KJG71217.1 hypothetical protein UA41_00895 [Photobacterium kishitanii]PSX20474.1 hypothetical protein C0W70_06285 [Photobacterium kishitanii]